MDYIFQKRKYGLFVHFVHELSCHSDGSLPQGMEETVNGFDVEGFADAVASTGAEYLILTAWHAKALPLYKSAVTEKYRGIKLPERDLLGEIIAAITARGIDMLLYTHPRDGHDFSPEDKLACGWGADIEGDKPDAQSFDYQKWNKYTLALYSELLERYGDQLCGIYTDGTGPYNNKSQRYEKTLQVLDYTKLRNLIKHKNPKLCMIQNHFGYLFSDDFEMPEGYFGFENDHFEDMRAIPAAKKALAICPFKGGWWPIEKTARGYDATMTTAAELARFAIFNASCTVGGGVCFASGPYCEGDLFPCGVIEQLSEVGALLRARRESVLDAVPSRSYPTLSGDTLQGLGGRCFTESRDGEYAYLHILDPRSALELKLPLPEDGATLHKPVSLSSMLRITAFSHEGDHYRLVLSGALDAVDSVIRFSRTQKAEKVLEWINDSDKRLHYEGDWKYVFLMQAKETHTALGAFESDYHVASSKGSAAFTYFEGSFVAVYGNKRPGNGSAQIYIDGVLSGELCENGADERRTCLFSSIDLCGGVHTLYIVTDSDAPFELDAIEIIA